MDTRRIEIAMRSADRQARINGEPFWVVRTRGEWAEVQVVDRKYVEKHGDQVDILYRSSEPA